MDSHRTPDPTGSFTRLFLCGDVMPGRGIDQILPYPSRPPLYEPCVRDAREYVTLAEAVNGPLPRDAGFGYVWGDALDELRQQSPQLRLVNLETSITTAEDYWRGKGINYRMHPGNTPLLTTAGIDGCVLANNHVLDWGYTGLSETLESLHMADVVAIGAGRNATSARHPEAFTVSGGRRVIVSAWGHESSGIPPEWAARDERPGVAFLPDLSSATVDLVARELVAVRRPGDAVVVSLHWGGNWGYRVPDAQIRFAHALIDRAGVDVVHGHSSHHPRPIEVYKGRLILYGCGDLLNDYEGIHGHEAFRGDLTLMYFIDLDRADGRLRGLTMCPMRIAGFRLNRVDDADAQWLRRLLHRIAEPFHTGAELTRTGRLRLIW